LRVDFFSRTDVLRFQLLWFSNRCPLLFFPTVKMSFGSLYFFSSTFPLFFICFFFSVFCSFLSSFPLFPPPAHLSSLVFINRKAGRATTRVQSWHRGRRVAERPLGGSLQDLFPLHFCLLAGVGREFCQGSSKWGEREKAGKIQGSKLLLPLPLRVQGKKENSVVQNDTISGFVFLE